MRIYRLPLSLSTSVQDLWDSIKRCLVDFIVALAITVAICFGADAQPVACYTADTLNSEMAAFENRLVTGDDVRKFVAAVNEASGQEIDYHNFDAIEVFDFGDAAGWAMFKGGCLLAVSGTDKDLNKHIIEATYGRQI